MPKFDQLIQAVVEGSCRIERSPRVLQLEGLFDVPPAAVSTHRFEVTLPLQERPWSIGLIVGASGTGKSSLARTCFADSLLRPYEWPTDRSILDAFPSHMSIKEVTLLLSNVGFSSPPSWLRPFGVLSTGEQFRVTMARAMAEQPDLVVCDEFTSVVDRTVAQVGCCAIARTIRERSQQFIAVTCHRDILDWLQPDWVYSTDDYSFTWRSLQRRPPIDLAIYRVSSAAWRLFHRYHYLTANINRSAQCVMAVWRDRPVAFMSWLSYPHPVSPSWRVHRSVCLPDYQGVGIGVALTDLCAGALAATGKRVTIVASHPAIIHHSARSPRWLMTSGPARHAAIGKTSGIQSLARSVSTLRLSCSFRYVGPALKDAAHALQMVSG